MGEGKQSNVRHSDRLWETSLVIPRNTKYFQHTTALIIETMDTYISIDRGVARLHLMPGHTIFYNTLYS